MLKMKSTIWICLLLAFTTTTMAQYGTGIVTYEEDVTLDLPEEVKLMLTDAPESIQSQKVLTFDDQHLSYVNVPKKKEDRKRRRRGFRFGNNKESIRYINYAEGVHLQKLNQFRKEFMVRDSMPEYTWKLSPGEQRVISGYTCIKAMTLRDTTDIVAWFTPEIPIPYGPDGLGGLPGLILGVGYGEDKAILAKTVNLKPADGVEVKVLEDGKDVYDRKDYDEMIEKKRKEMEKMWSGSRKRGRIRG